MFKSDVSKRSDGKESRLLDGAATKRARLVIETLGGDNAWELEKARVFSSLEGAFVVSQGIS